MLNILKISLSSKRQSKGISPPRQIFKVYNMNIFRFCFLVFYVVMYCSVYVCTKDLDGNKPIWLFRAIPGLYLFLCRMFLQFGIFVICTLRRNKMKWNEMKYFWPDRISGSFHQVKTRFVRASLLRLWIGIIYSIILHCDFWIGKRVSPCSRNTLISFSFEEQWMCPIK